MSSPLRLAGAVHGDGRGKAGVLLLILSETTFFAVFLVAYLFYIGKSLYPPYPAEVLSLPVFATIALLSSSVTIVFAVRDLERGDVGRFGVGLFATVLLGAIFIAMTAAEWNELIYEHGLTIKTNLFGTTFFSLVGFHAAHVTLGVGIMAGHPALHRPRTREAGACGARRPLLVVLALRRRRVDRGPARRLRGGGIGMAEELRSSERGPRRHRTCRARPRGRCSSRWA